MKGKSGKFDGNYLYSLVESFKVFASNSGTFWPVVWFLVLYYIIFVFYIFGLQDACTKPNQQNCTNSTSMWKSKEAFRFAVTDSNEKWTIITEVMGIFLGLFVASMMSRWWAQVSSMPDISPVAMVLNCWVKSGEGSLELKIVGDRSLRFGSVHRQNCYFGKIRYFGRISTSVNLTEPNFRPYINHIFL